MNITLTPISAKATSPAAVDYSEQLARTQETGLSWCWDDSRYNNSETGQLFGFYFHGKKVIVHRILDIQPPTKRLPSWTANVGQQNRNVLLLSDPLCEFSWKEWLELNGPQSKMGTYVCRDLERKRPLLFQFFERNL